MTTLDYKGPFDESVAAQARADYYAASQKSPINFSTVPDQSQWVPPQIPNSPNLGGRQGRQSSPDNPFSGFVEQLRHRALRMRQGQTGGVWGQPRMPDVPVYTQGQPQSTNRPGIPQSPEVLTPAPQAQTQAVPQSQPQTQAVSPAQQAYNDMGMGGWWLPSSQNQHLAGQQLPPALAMLASYGIPLTPDLVASVTGQSLGPANPAYAFQQRGGGILPSYQTFSRMTPDIRELFRSYVTGPVGLPWENTYSAMTGGTQNLRAVPRAY